MKIQNISEGPRGLNTDEGQVILARGEEADVTLSAAERKVAEGTGWFKISGATPKSGPSKEEKEASDKGK